MNITLRQFGFRSTIVDVVTNFNGARAN